MTSDFGAIAGPHNQNGGSYFGINLNGATGIVNAQENAAHTAWWDHLSKFNSGQYKLTLGTNNGSINVPYSIAANEFSPSDAATVSFYFVFLIPQGMTVNGGSYTQNGVANPFTFDASPVPVVTLDGVKYNLRTAFAAGGITSLKTNAPIEFTAFN